MNNTKMVTSLETLGLTLLVTVLTFVASNASAVDPQYGPSVGVLAMGLANLINGWLNRPAEKIVSLAIGKPVLLNK